MSPNEVAPGFLSKRQEEDALRAIGNDGSFDVVVNCVSDVPQLLRCQKAAQANWIKLMLTGTISNRSAIGARVSCRAEDRRQIHEVRSGGSYISQNDLRIHFGLGAAEQADIEIRWPSGVVDRYPQLACNRIHKLVDAAE